MKIIRYMPGRRLERPSVVAIGKFDGVHAGHKAIIEKSLQIADTEKKEHLVCTFEPSPNRVFDKTDVCLNNLRTKIRLLEQLGVTKLLLVHFRRPFCDLEPGDFIKHFLLEDLRVCHLVTGKDFKFGKNRTGGGDELKEAAAKLGFSYWPIEDYPNEQARISSSQIRSLLTQGKVKEANALLGSPYRIRARIIAGEGMGKKMLGTATANMNLKNFVPPLRGVFVCQAVLPNDEKRKAVVNCGFRPTVAGERLSLEAHLFDYAGNLYGKTLCLEFLDYLRAEKKFSGLDALRRQIDTDKNRALALFKQDLLMPMSAEIKTF